MDKTEDYKPEEKKDGRLIDTIPYEGVPEKGYVPEGFESEEDFLCDMRQEYNADVAFDQENRDAAIEDKAFAAGEQWDPLVLESRKGLPCLIINSIPQFTAQLVGDWRESRRAVKVVPSNNEDQDVASIRGDLIRSIEMHSRANRVYDAAFESMVQCGDGAFRVVPEYARDDVFDQDLYIRPIDDCHSVVYDRFSVDPTARDAKRIFVNDRVPKKEAHEKWGDSCDFDALQDQPFLLDLRTSGWIDDESYQITEYWRLIERQRLVAMFENGKVIDIEDETKFEELVQLNGNVVKTRVAWCSFAQMHLCTGFKILSGPYEYRLNRLPIIRMSGRVVNIKGRRVRHGLVRFMKDPVRLRNFNRSVGAEQLGYATKAQWIATHEAVEGYEDQIRQSHLKRDPLLVVADAAVIGQNIQRLDPPAPQAAYLHESQQNVQDMKDVTGIHDASLGMRSNEVSGRAIQARQREGDIASLTYFDNANDAILECGDVLNQLIPQIYDGSRVIRCIGEDEAQKFIKINDPMDPSAIDLSVGLFDVALSTGTSYTTRRVEAAQAMMEAIQVWPNLMQVAGDLVAKAQDWPGAEKLSERLRKTIPAQFLTEEEQQEAGGPGMSPEEIMMMQQQLQQLTMENQELKMDRTLEEKKIEIDSYNAKTQRIKALSDHEVDNQQVSLKAVDQILKGSAELDKLELQKEEKEAQYQASRDDSDRNYELAKTKSTSGGTSSSTSGQKSQQKKANG